jgi:nucleoside-diphosphate-sugar epimerase
MMKVFVAGATGAIGQQLVPRLMAAGHVVHGMTRSESKQAMLYELGAVPALARDEPPGVFRAAPCSRSASRSWRHSSCHPTTGQGRCDRPAGSIFS